MYSGAKPTIDALQKKRILNVIRFSARRQYSVSSFSMVQHIMEMTHFYNGMLDIMVTFLDEIVDNVPTEPPDVMLNHGLLLCYI